MFEVFVAFFGSMCVGVLGGLLGVGGGIFLVPLLVTFTSVQPIQAVGVSLFCVIGTSIGGTTEALRVGRPNVGLALFMESFMIIGSVAASFAAQKVSSSSLLVGFAVLMFILGAIFFVRRNAKEVVSLVPADHGQQTFDHTFEGPTGLIKYRPVKLSLLGVLMVFTGSASGFFGIGGGSINVPILSLLGKVPLRAAAATSTLTMSVTGCVAGLIHLLHGTVPVALVGASLLGVIPGGRLGAKIQKRLEVKSLRMAFVFLMFAVGGLTLKKALEFGHG